MTWILTPRWIGKLKIAAIALDSRNLSLYIGATSNYAHLDSLSVASVFAGSDREHIAIFILFTIPPEVHFSLILFLT